MVCVTDNYLSIIQKDAMIRLVAFINPPKINDLNWKTIETIVRAQYDY
jgi:hypothetical protein